MTKYNYCPEFFKTLGAKIVKIKVDGEMLKRRYLSHFGTLWNNVHAIWVLFMYLTNLPDGLEPKHLLWGLLHCKSYGLEETLASKVGVDEKTFRKWSYTVRHLMTIVIEEKVSIFYFILLLFIVYFIIN